MYTNIEEEYSDYLRDESRLHGKADSISFPRNSRDILSVLARVRERNMPLTIQGGRTGISAGAVPLGGHILNLSRMNRILALGRKGENGPFLLTVQPGLVLEELRTALADKRFQTENWDREALRVLGPFLEAGPVFFPPDPTETSATLGGMVACNASGACSFHYGPTRNFIEGLEVVLADGSLVQLKRGQTRAEGRDFSLPRTGAPPLKGTLPAYELPNVKNASGYHSAEDMDLVDLFIGSEGTLGIISGIVCRLHPAPGQVTGITAFFQEEKQALHFVRLLRDDHSPSSFKDSGHGEESRDRDPRLPRAIEFFDSHALKLLDKKNHGSSLAALPPVPPGCSAAVYVEYHTRDALEAEEALQVFSGFLEESGGDLDLTWMADSDKNIDHLKGLRHAVPEAVNLLIDERRKQYPELTKLGTDMAVPDDRLEWVFDLYRSDLKSSGLEYVMFGHVGNNHIHVNILPRDMGEYEEGRKLYEQWGRRVVGVGGSVSAEHGIGKLKKSLLKEMYGEEGIDAMRRLKQLFDPEGMLNPGNLF